MPKDAYHGPLERVNDCCWRIPKSYKHGMRVDGIDLRRRAAHRADPRRPGARSRSPTSLSCPASSTPAWPCPTFTGATASASAASAPPIRTRAASSRPGGVGYDINCGVRLVRSNLFYRDVKPRLKQLVDDAVPPRAHRRRPRRASIALTRKELRRLLSEGPAFLVERGLATQSDLDHTEAHGRLAGADPDMRQRPRLGARRRSVRHARLRQSLPGSPGRRRDLRRARRPRSWAWRRT